MKNTIAVNGEEQCVFITDRGFYSESNISDMEQAGLAYIILLTRDSELLRYEHLSGIDKSDIYFLYESVLY